MVTKMRGGNKHIGIDRGHEILIWPGNEAEVKKQTTGRQDYEVIQESEFVEFFNKLSDRAKREVVDYYNSSSTLDIALDVASFIPQVRAARLANKLFCFVRKKIGSSKGKKGAANNSDASDESVSASANSSQQTPEATPKPNNQGAAKNKKGNSTPASKHDTQCGDPVSMVTGEEVLQLDDFELPGPIPFIWQRMYRSGQSKDVGLGHGWTHSGCETLFINDLTIELRDSEARTIIFARPRIGQRSKQLAEAIDLDFISEQRIILRKVGEADRVFDAYGQQQFRLTELRHVAYKHASPGWREERGFILRLQRNAQGLLSRIEGNWGRGLQLIRNAEGRITAIAQLNENNEPLDFALASYEYDESGDLTAHRNADGHGDRYQYQNHILTRRTLPTGYNFHFEWDQHNNSGRCLRQYGDHGYYDYQFNWDPTNKTSHATNGRGFSSTYQYNQWGRLDRQIDNCGNATHFGYNDAGQLIEETDALGNSTHYHVDDYSRPTGMTDVLGNRTSLGYFQDRVIRVNDAEKNSWQRTFNSRGLVETITGPNGEVSRYDYDAHGLIQSITAANGQTTYYHWNNNAELIKERDALGNVTHFKYDAYGRIGQVTVQAKDQTLAEAQHNSTHYRYSAAGRAIETISNRGSSHFQYNENGMLTRHSDAQGRVTEFKYQHGLNQPIERIDPAGNRLQYKYDQERLLTALINENGDRYQFFYDGEERLIKEIGFDGRVQAYEYNAAGHLIRHLDSDEVEHQFERDALGRLLKKTSRSLITRDNEFSQYRYDNLSRLTESHNQHQFVGFAYDAYGNITQEIQADLEAGRAIPGTMMWPNDSGH